ncbi:tail tape measure protein [Streptococcus suis]|nr:tail tape measure protein [Streptococcus suis]
MADGTVTIKANFDGKDAESGVSRIKSALGGLKDSAGKIGSVFKSVLGANLVSSAITSSLTAIGDSLKGAFAGAIQEGGALQQSVGGVKTLYAGAEKEVMSFASSAYKAGISANSYMEQATSFGAALKQSFGGDAVKAANAANTAIMDMADNSAKMGTDIGVVQQTYQSLARGNYAMLDNLKLGYGGTKAEMQRLLETATKLTGKNFDLNNFGDVVEAIHAVQEDLNLSGVAASEASTTFTGSLGAMKASWANAVGALTSGEIDIGPQLQGLATTTSNFLFNNFFPMVGRVFKELPGAIGTFIEAAKPKVAEGLSNLFKGLNIDIKPEAIERGIDNLVSKITKFGSQVKEFFSNFANTGAFSALGSAFSSIAGAVGNFFATISGGKGDWSDFGTTLGNVVTKLAEGATKLADFIGKMDPGRLRSWIATIAAVAGGFKIFSAVTGSSPVGAILDKLGNKFSTFGNKGKAGTDKAGSGTGLLGQLFQGVGTLITSVASGISTVLQGLGTAIATVAQGFGQAAAMASPTQWLSMGAAMLMVGAGVALASAGIYILVQAAIQLASAGTGAQIAMVAFGVGIAALAGIFALLGPALTAGAVGIGVFGAAVLAIGAGIALASAGLSMLAGHLPQIAAYGASAGVAIAALGAGMLAMGAGAMVAGAGLMVAGAGLAVVGAGALVAAAGAAVLGAGLLVTAAGVAAFGLALNLAQPGISTFSSAITKVVSAISGGLTSVINAVSGAIRSVGTAALNAGKGFNQLASGISKITSLNIFDMGASLAAVAAGLVAIVASGIGTAGPGLQAAGTGLRLIATSAQMASATIQLLPTAFSTLSASLGTLPAMMTMAGTAMTTFATSAQGSVMSLMAIGATITQFATMMMTIGPASSMASAGLAMFNGQASAAGNAMQRLGSSAQSAQASVVALGSGIVSSMAGATAAIASAGSQMSSAVRSAGTQMLTAMQSAMNQVTSSVRNGMTNSASAVRNGGSQMASALRSSGSQMVSATQNFMNQIVSAVRNGMNNVVAAVRNGGSQMVSAMRSAGTQLVTTVQSAVNQAANAARSGYGAFQSAGSYIGQGLATGMQSAVGAVRAAANALVAEAERAAQAKAKINSPSHLFRDEVGWWIGLGVAKGIDNSAPEVANSLDFIRDQVHGFSLKSQNLLTGASASMSSQLRLETLRGKTPKVEADARQEAYIAHSASLLSDVIDSLAELRDQVAQGQQMVLDTGALVGGTASAYDNAIGNLQNLKGRHRL